MHLLEVESLSVTYGGIRAVKEVDLYVDQGEAVAVLGPNGAGKSSTLNALAGLIPASAGSVAFEGMALRGKAPEDIARRGIALVPEGRRLFARLTVEENLAVGYGGRRRPTRGREMLGEVSELFPILSTRRNQLAGTLSGGEQQQLAIARALACNPKLLLLDEPSLGLAPQIRERIFDLIATLKERGLTFVLVEQSVDLALEVADRAYVLGGGEVRLKGAAAEILGSTDLERTYLGLGETSSRSAGRPA